MANWIVGKADAESFGAGIKAEEARLAKAEAFFEKSSVSVTGTVAGMIGAIASFSTLSGPAALGFASVGPLMALGVAGAALAYAGAKISTESLRKMEERFVASDGLAAVQRAESEGKVGDVRFHSNNYGGDFSPERRMEKLLGKLGARRLDEDKESLVDKVVRKIGF